MTEILDIKQKIRQKHETFRRFKDLEYLKTLSVVDLEFLRILTNVKKDG